MPDEGRRSCSAQEFRVGKGGNFEKSPVSSMELGTMRCGLQRKKGIFRSNSRSMAIWNFCRQAADCPNRLPRLRSADVKIARAKAYLRSRIAAIALTWLRA